MMKFV